MLCCHSLGQKEKDTFPYAFQLLPVKSNFSQNKHNFQFKRFKKFVRQRVVH